jgi:alpha-1,6-mannosyltransferase
VLAGAASAAAYTLLITLPLRLDSQAPSQAFDLAKALGTDGAGLARFLLTMALLFGLYLMATFAAHRAGQRCAWLALGLGAMMMLALLPAHPWYSRDVHHYIASMRVLYTHGQNPYLVPPAAVSGDALTTLADWSWLPSPYGPVWTLLTALPAAAGRSWESATVYLIAFKALAAGCALGAAWLAGATAERLRAGTRTFAVVLVAWNPLVVLHAAGDGHNDATMLLFVSAAMYLVVRGRPVWAGWALAGGALVKFVPVLLLPLLVTAIWRSGRPRWRWESGMVVLAFPIAALLAYLPFWDGWQTLRPTLEEGSYLTTSPQAVLAVLFTGSLPGETAGGLVSVGSRLLFVPVLMAVLLQTRRREDVPGQGALALLGWLAVASPWFMPWYALWPLVLAAAVPWRRGLLAVVLALTAGALFLPAVTGYLMPMSGQGRSWPLLHILGVAVVWGPVALTSAVLWWRPWRTWTEASASRSVAASRAPVAGEASD